MMITGPVYFIKLLGWWKRRKCNEDGSKIKKCAKIMKFLVSVIIRHLMSVYLISICPISNVLFDNRTVLVEKPKCLNVLS